MGANNNNLQEQYSNDQDFRVVCVVGTTHTNMQVDQGRWERAENGQKEDDIVNSDDQDNDEEQGDLKQFKNNPFVKDQINTGQFYCKKKTKWKQESDDDDYDQVNDFNRIPPRGYKRNMSVFKVYDKQCYNTCQSFAEYGRSDPNDSSSPWLLKQFNPLHTHPLSLSHCFPGMLTQTQKAQDVIDVNM